MKNAPEIQCPSCSGKGKVILRKTLAFTLSKFKPTSRLTANDVRGKGTPNAANNRLENLRKLGLLTREREGKSWSYFRTTGEPVPVIDPPREPKTPTKHDPTIRTRSGNPKRNRSKGKAKK